MFFKMCISICFRHYEAALKLMQKAVTPTSVKAAYHDSSEVVQNRVYKSLKLWSMYADLEESFGTFKVRKNGFIILKWILMFNCAH